MKKIVIGIIIGLTFVGVFAYAQYSPIFWYPDGNDLRPTEATWNLRIPSLVSCDTIDTDGSGVFSCGTDATGIGLWSTSTGFTYLTDTTSDLVVGDSTTSTAPFWIDVSTGNLTLTGGLIASGTSTLATTTIAGPFAIDSSGNVTSGTWQGTAIDISSYTNLAAGRSLTLVGDSVEADNELYNKIFSISIRNATTTDNPVAQHKLATTFTITRISCSTDVGTATIQFDERAEATATTTGTDVMNAALVCDTNTEATTTFANASIAADAPISLDIDALSSATKIFIHVEGTYDD